MNFTSITIRPPGSARFHLLEAARGAACLWVLLFHSLTNYPPQTLSPILAAVRRVSEPGWLGVHVFFALSGWCIAERLAAALRRNETSPAFLRERFMRIYPTYWAAAAVTLAVRLAASRFNGTSAAGNLPAGPAAWLGNVFLIEPYLHTAPCLIVSWSLVYELGFYVIGAAALAAARRGAGAAALMGAGAALCLFPLTGAPPSLLYVVGLWPDFFSGVLAWFAARASGRPRAAAAAGLAALALLTWLRPEVFGGIGRMVAVGSAAALAGLFPLDSRLAPSRLVRGLGSIGVISYSLYLIHVTVMSPLFNLTTRRIDPLRRAFIPFWLASVGLALAGGWLLHLAVEGPVERWRKRRYAPRVVPIAQG